MTLSRNEYDGAYYGDKNFDLKHKAGYTNYQYQCKQANQQKYLERFLKTHKIPRDAKILELGAGLGHLGKLARVNEYNNWTCVDWSQWCQDNKVYDSLVNMDAIEFLKSRLDKSFDYIISRGLIECFTDIELITFARECFRVGKKQIHATFVKPNSKYYTVKNLDNWKTVLGNIPDIIVESYFENG